MKHVFAYLLVCMAWTYSVPGIATASANETTKENASPALQFNSVAPGEKSSLTKPAIAKETKPGRPQTGEFPTVSQPDLGTGVVQVTLGLFVVLLIIAAAAWFTRRFGHFQATAGGTLRIVGGLHLGSRERLVVVQVGEQQILLGVAPGRISSLHVLDKPLEQGAAGVSGTSQTTGTFLEKLNTVLKRQS